MSNPHKGSSLEDLYKELGELEEVKKLGDKKIRLQQITEILAEFDPEDFIKGGAPKDHYKSEARSIVLRCEEGKEITGQFVRDVWLYWFGTDHDSDHVGDMEMREVFHNIALRIQRDVMNDSRFQRKPFMECRCCGTQFTQFVSECSECGFKVGDRFRK